MNFKCGHYLFIQAGLEADDNNKHRQGPVAGWSWNHTKLELERGLEALDMGKLRP